MLLARVRVSVLPSGVLSVSVALIHYLWLFIKLGHFLGSCCSTAAERTAHNGEVICLIPTGCWAFSFFLSSEMCPYIIRTPPRGTCIRLIQVIRGGAALQFFL